MVDAWDEEAPTAPPVPAPFERFTGDYTTFFRGSSVRSWRSRRPSPGADRAEEIAQEALLRAHREWDRIARYDKPGAWVRRVTINLATSSRRRRRQRAARACSGWPPGAQLDAPPPEVDGFWALVRASARPPGRRRRPLLPRRPEHRRDRRRPRLRRGHGQGPPAPRPAHPGRPPPRPGARPMTGPIDRRPRPRPPSIDARPAPPAEASTTTSTRQRRP